MRKFCQTVCWILLAGGIAFGQTDQLNISWDANPEPDIDYYRLQKSLNSTSDFSDFINVDHPTTSAQDTDVVPGNLYAYRIEAVDTEGLTSGYSSIVSVGLPVILLELSQIHSGSDTTFDATPWLVDPDHSISDFTFEVTGETNCDVGGAAEFMTITPVPIDFVGSASFTLRIEDPIGFYDIKTLSFEFVEGGTSEFIIDIPSARFSEDEGFQIWLDTCVVASNFDAEDLAWSFEPGADLDYSYNSSARILTVVSQTPDWSGSDTFLATATAPDNSTASDEFLVTIDPMNDAPIASISHLFISENPDENLVDLDDYVIDVDNSLSELDWDFWGFSDFQITWEDETGNVIRITPLSQTLIETGTFSVFDPDGAADTVSVTIEVIEDPNEFFIVEVPDQRFDEDALVNVFMDTCVNISDYSPADISWSFTAGDDIDFSFNSDTRILTLQSAEADWFGQNQVSAIGTAPDQSTAGDTFFVDVDPLNDSPAISMGTLFVEDDPDSNLFNLNAYAVDVDNTGSDLTWNFWGYAEFTIEWEDAGAGIIRITPGAGADEETGFFSVTDPFGAADTSEVTIRLLDSGEIVFELEVPDVQMNEDFSFDILMDTTLTLSHYSPNQISWSFLAGIDLQYDYNPLTRKLTVRSLADNWFGVDEMVAVALAPDQSTRVDTFEVNIVAVNDVPFANIDELFVSPLSNNIFDLKLYVSDADDDPAEMDWQFWGFDQFTISWFDEPNKLIQIFPASGAASQMGFFRVVDPGGAADTAQVTLAYIENNTAPNLKFPYLISMGEDSSAALNLVRYIADSTHTISELDITFEAGSNIELNFSEADYRLEIVPEQDWSGESSFTVTATDPLGLSTSQTILVSVQERNDLETFTLTAPSDDAAVFTIVTELPSVVDLSYWREVFQIITISRTNYLTQHSIRVENLDSDATYHFSLRITDESGKVITISDSSFQTGTLSTPVVSHELVVYPNPIKPARGHNEMIFLNLPGETQSISLYTIMGEKIYDEDVAVAEMQHRIPVVGGPVYLPSGVYVYLVRDSNSRVLDRGKVAIIR